MAFKLGISTLALGALLLGSTAARADDDDARRWNNNNEQNAQQNNWNGQDDDGLNRWNSNAQNSWNNDWNGPQDGQQAFRYDDDDERTRRFLEVHVHTGACHHGQAPRPVDSRGRYALQTVQRWVPARYEQVWVPEQCYERGHGRGRGHGHGRGGETRCRGGYYEQRMVPGRYETVQEWVWVPYGGRRWHDARPANYWR